MELFENYKQLIKIFHVRHCLNSVILIRMVQVLFNTDVLVKMLN